MQKPLKHHFLPVFYLKQWTNREKVVEFSKPYGGVVKPRRVHPSGTGFISKLYATSDLSGVVAVEFETDFLSPIDSRAADALQALLEASALTTSQRSSWAAFVLSLITRMPEDIAILKEMIKEITIVFAPVFERFYQASLPCGEPSKFKELTSVFIAKSEERALRHARNIMSHERLLSNIFDMHWSVLSLENKGPSLLTSDRPVVYTNTLGGQNSHFIVPISLRHLFVAANDENVIKSLRKLDQRRVISEMNGLVVGCANRFVYGTGDEQRRFVQNRMGLSRYPQLVERLFQKQRENYDELIAAINTVKLDEAQS